MKREKGFPSRCFCYLAVALFTLRMGMPTRGEAKAPLEVGPKTTAKLDYGTHLRLLYANGELYRLTAFCMQERPGQQLFLEAQRLLQDHRVLFVAAKKLAMATGAASFSERYPFDLSSHNGDLFRATALLFAAAGRVAMLQGNKKEALEYEALLFRLGKRAGGASNLSGALTQAAVIKLALENMRFFLSNGGEDAQFLRSCMRCYAQGYRPPNFVAALKKEEARIKTLAIQQQGAFKKELQAMAYRLKRAIPLEARPYWRVKQALKALDQEAVSQEGAEGKGTYLPTFYEEISKIRAVVMGEAALTRSALALLLYRAQKGGFPQQVHRLAHWPTDPYSGSKVGYNKRERGFYVYLEDKTAAMQKGYLWNPGARPLQRQPSKTLRAHVRVALLN